MATSTHMWPTMQVASDVAGPVQGNYTYHDYAALPANGQRYEVVGGVLYVVPSAGEVHQFANGWIFYYVFGYLGLSGGYLPPLEYLVVNLLCHRPAYPVWL